MPRLALSRILFGIAASLCASLAGSDLANASVPAPNPGRGILVAASGDAAPGVANSALDGSLFSIFGPPAIDESEDVAFHAYVKPPAHAKAIPAAENNGIWLYQTADVSVVARTGDANNPAPGTTGAVFTKLSDPVLSGGGELAFLGSFAGGPSKVKASSGIFVTKAGTTTLVCQAGAAAPGVAGGSYAKFEEVAVENGGGIAFLATIKGAGITAKNNLGIWATDRSGNIVLVAQNGEALPNGGGGVEIAGFTVFKPLKGVSGQSRSVDTIGGNVTFLARAKMPSNSIIGAANGAASFTVGKLAGVGGNVPNLPNASVKSLDEPIANLNKTVAFLGTIEGKDAQGKAITSADDSAIGLFVANVGSIAVRTGDTVAPDENGGITAGALFSKLSDPVLNNDDHYGFIGALKPGVGDTAKNGSNDAGIWTNFSGTLERVARKGDSAPGTQGIFASFEQLVLPDFGGAIFTAKLSGVAASEAQGLWAVNSSRDLTLVIETGNTLEVNSAAKTVKSFSVFQLPTAVLGQSRSFDADTQNLVYTAAFTDGTSGIFKVPARVNVCTRLLNGHPFQADAHLFRGMPGLAAR